MNIIEATEEKIKVMQAFVDDEDVEQLYRTGITGWSEIDIPSWDWTQYDYRIKEASPNATPLNIPWDWIDKAYNYAAMDEECEVYIFEKRPSIDGYIWVAASLKYEELDSVLLDNTKIREGVNWKTSLTERPKK